MTTPLERYLAIRVVLLPKDTNHRGTIFGGVILSQIDLAGAEEARRWTQSAVVTVGMEAVEFHQPVYMGDVVSFWTSLVRTGTSSITVHVEVEAERWSGAREVVKVTEAKVTYVAVDAEGRKTAIRSATPAGPQQPLGA